MAQFTVYKNLSDRSGAAPFVIDLQAGLLDVLQTRVVAPLIPAERMRAARHVNPVFEIDGRRYVMSTAELAGVPLNVLGAEVAELSACRAEIVAALDFLFTGY